MFKDPTSVSQYKNLNSELKGMIDECISSRKYREQYNQRKEVKEKRSEYMKKRNEMIKEGLKLLKNQK